MSTESAVKLCEICKEVPATKGSVYCAPCRAADYERSNTLNLARSYATELDADKKSESAVKHTPGPWEFEHARGFDRIVYKDHEFCERIYACDPGPELDFTIGFVRDVDLKQRVANARLIAAAPAMLIELQDAHYEFVGLAAYLATCAPGTIIGNLETTVASLHKKADEFELVIKKAKGE